MFWGDRMARTVDPFGNEWTVSCACCVLRLLLGVSDMRHCTCIPQTSLQLLLTHAR